MTDNVVHAFGAAEPDKLSEEMLAQIEEFVDLIKAGQLVGVALAGVARDGAVNTGWCRQPNHHFALIGACERLKQRLLNSGHDIP